MARPHKEEAERPCSQQDGSASLYKTEKRQRKIQKQTYSTTKCRPKAARGQCALRLRELFLAVEASVWAVVRLLALFSAVFSPLLRARLAVRASVVFLAFLALRFSDIIVAS